MSLLNEIRQIELSHLSKQTESIESIAKKARVAIEGIKCSRIARETCVVMRINFRITLRHSKWNSIFIVFSTSKIEIT